MVCVKTERREHLNLSFNGVILLVVDSVKYLGFIFGTNGAVVVDISSKVNKGAKMLGEMSWCKCTKIHV